MNIFIEPQFTSHYQKSPLFLIDIGASGGLEDNWKSAKKYLKVLGFEPDKTAWERSIERCWSEDWEHREIVQIGAVLVDAAADFEQLDSFNRFIKPTRNPLLSNYFTALDPPHNT